VIADITALGPAAVALIVGLGGGAGIVSLLRLRVDKDSRIVQTANEFATQASRIATDLVGPLREELTIVRERVAKLEKGIELAERAEAACLEREKVLHDKLKQLEARLGGRRTHDQ